MSEKRIPAAIMIEALRQYLVEVEGLLEESDGPRAKWEASQLARVWEAAVSAHPALYAQVPDEHIQDVAELGELPMSTRRQHERVVPELEKLGASKADLAIMRMRAVKLAENAKEQKLADEVSQHELQELVTCIRDAINDRPTERVATLRWNVNLRLPHRGARLDKLTDETLEHVLVTASKTPGRPQKTIQPAHEGDDIMSTRSRYDAVSELAVVVLGSRSGHSPSSVKAAWSAVTNRRRKNQTENRPE